MDSNEKPADTLLPPDVTSVPANDKPTYPLPPDPIPPRPTTPEARSDDSAGTATAAGLAIGNLTCESKCKQLYFMLLTFEEE